MVRSVTVESLTVRLLEMRYSGSCWDKTIGAGRELQLFLFLKRVKA